MFKIGISACFMYKEPSRIVFGPKNLAYVECDMFSYVSQKGILPVLIPDLPMQQLEDILAELDGFVFQGGTDLAPETYNETPIVPGKWLGDAYRDAYELRIMEYAVKHNKPVLAICRGFQLMNVFFGGSLYQDIITQNPDAMQHRDAEKYDALVHEIVFEAGKTLDLVYDGIDQPIVNSVHHQGVKTVGKGLEVLAVSKNDGIIEALQNKVGNVLGVQWHPEFSVGKGAPLLDPLKLYEYFIEKVKNQ
ncbi:gamma-glutamyl-gamma-aminobutyrate hydrolase family protein [Cyclobacterium marinum]|uniref:Peptidase C26 n=1 Tax=Cyclobacterium marinum (strain ATCC 25205 / DSM 745 / LMG 13164 / NCIMB 1802) TaxID=880070 RepID=G0IYX6_CYCMS|nr:gamma-glutamyl-gamma-aminobutyrate hydrolase family protein [Cyclobacterium marinum]AEL28121.1 peptidase C26 [Cyclobacterium marinum DSM 745]MBI0397889.1 gamma-glutamyl-gamma-aminobutyrate hydrolase family protein [Cyclobacterium marinum]